MAAETAADAELAKSRDDYQTKIDRIKDQMAIAQTRYQEADAVAAAKREENLLGTAGDLLGAFLGGRSGSTALKKRASRRAAVAKAEATAESEATRYHSKHAELAALENELAVDVEAVASKRSQARWSDSRCHSRRATSGLSRSASSGSPFSRRPLGRQREVQTVSTSALSKSRMETTPSNAPSSSTTGRCR